MDSFKKTARSSLEFIKVCGIFFRGIALHIIRLSRFTMIAKQVSRKDTLCALNEFLPSIKNQIKTMLGSVCGRHQMPETIAARVENYYSRCLDYNIVGGKLARARTVCETLYFCRPDLVEGESELFKAAMVLGWCVEILQAFFLIEDDVMDRGETRRGKPCWFRDSQVGVANAINDGLLLEQVLYELIELNEHTKPISVQAHRILRDAAMRTVIGQHLDTCPPSDVREFNRDQWLSVVRFKTAFYTFSLPCELGILVSGKKFPESDIATLRDICLFLGELFQAQDDMLDCFGDPAVIGKVGRDIEEGKCTWLWYTAMNATSNHKELIQLYSSEARRSDPDVVRRIKQLYRDIGLESLFADYSKNMTSDIVNRISSLSSPELRDLATWLLESTMNRQK
jgi:farnesyl diphosphate synthase